MNCLIAIHSVKDCRTVPLFPCICGDDGTARGFDVESFARRTHHVCIPGERTEVPVYCYRCIGHYADPYPHYACAYLGCYADEGTCCAYPHYCLTYCGCWCDPCSAYCHYECVCVGTCTIGCGGCSYDVNYMELYPVPAELKRLGPKSRAAVMSLYRAIIERFHIMRATGCASCRPTGESFGAAFGFDPVFLKDNACSDKRALAGENRRRAFGGVFRDTISKLYTGAYQATAELASKCGVVFYPFTPYIEPLDFSSTFLPCVKEYGSSSAITWWNRQAQTFSKIVGDACGGSHEALWVLDNGMQPDIISRHYQSCRRPLLRDVIAAYREFMRSNDCACSYLYYALCRELPDERLKSFTGDRALQNLAYYCGITTFEGAMARFFDPNDCHIIKRFWLPALGLALRMLSPLNAQTVRRCSSVAIPHKRITANFTLPIGVVDRHLVIGSERSCFTICDVTLGCALTCARLTYSLGGASFASREIYYNLNCREWPPEYCTCTTEVPIYACVCVPCYSDPYPHYDCVCVGTRRTEPRPHYDCVCVGCWADPYPHYDCGVYCGCYCDPCSAYPHYECRCVGCWECWVPVYCYVCVGCWCDWLCSHWERRCVGACTYTCCYPNPNRGYVAAECWERWGYRERCTGPQSEHCASVTMRAIWPDLSGSGFQFGGAAYPARWAVLECDVAFGAVSAFVKGRNCNERAWVVNGTSNVRRALGDCKDLMTVLGRGLIRAGIKRAICDQSSGGVCGNTFSGVCFPTTQSGVTREMVGDNHADNIRVIRCAAGRSGGGGGGGTGWYHHLRIAGCGAVFGYLDAAETGGGIEITPATFWYDGTWLQLGLAGGGSIGFGYDRDYYDCGGGGSCCGCCSGGGASSVCARHGWNLDRSSVQFGGFFGTFIFNNRAARQGL